MKTTNGRPAEDELVSAVKCTVYFVVVVVVAVAFMLWAWGLGENGDPGFAALCAGDPGPPPAHIRTGLTSYRLHRNALEITDMIATMPIDPDER
jgi:hypothetical protein